MTRRRAVIILLAAALLVPIVLAIDTAPLLPETGAPAAEQVRAGQTNFRRLRDALAGPPPQAMVRFGDADARAIATLVGNAVHVHRVDAGVAAALAVRHHAPSGHPPGPSSASGRS